ncbi:helix-turn-helix domain-containing protein [Coraliomargarita sp. SDUM461003]|uniref:Helix-turn-helix domain-containing protein n=1 Tax=Thalassobacterium maritimum TaxID=3041265 RepID=A0ABU1APT6_9BACT|nr:helix-turn-helix domain-containing protein [Coraliomargarita sp. SDUM461003]MDQ8206186.1 helix-turn-helix domain-containing protein [Coraliomargarita sp. SDUM461003]
MTEPLVKVGTLPQSEHVAAMKALEIAAKARPSEEYKETRMLTRKEAAVRLGVCPATVSRMYHAGELQGRYLRPDSYRSLRISSKSIDEVINA